MSPLLAHYCVDVQHPGVSGAEHLEMLQIRDQLAGLEPTLTAEEKAALDAADRTLACQTDDDLPWILTYAGEHSLVIDTDYGHTDPSSELDAISVLRQHPDIGPETKERILHHNPKALDNLES